MTDEQLYKKTKFYGHNALFWRRKFIGLLPEINRRRLYEKKNFSSIFEFAFKLAGLSEQQVRTTLNLEKRFSDKPALKALLEKGEVSVNKLVRIQSIATSQNEEELAETVKILSQCAIETLVRDEKMFLKDFSGTFVRDEKGLPCPAICSKDDLNKPQINAKSLRAQDQDNGSNASQQDYVNQEHTLHLNKKVTEKLLELQKKGIDVNELLLEFLDRRKQEIAEEKETISAELQKTESRYIPVRIKKIIVKEHGHKCSIPTCNKTAEHLHHTQIFSLSGRHDPNYLAPLCKEHHLIAHTVNLIIRKKRQSARC